MIETKSKLTKDDLIQFEEEIKELFLDGKIRTPVHLATGSEDKLIEIFKNVHENDWVFSAYRSHYHALLKGIPAEQLKKEIVNGHSMHINSYKHRFFTSSIVGGCLSIAVGVAMAIQRQELSDWVWVFVGDMAAEMGIFYECHKYAKRHNLPITFVVEDNSLSVNTPTAECWGNDITAPPNKRDTFNSKGGCIRFEYERVYPHQGSGDWVVFH